MDSQAAKGETVNESEVEAIDQELWRDISGMM